MVFVQFLPLQGEANFIVFSFSLSLSLLWASFMSALLSKAVIANVSGVVLLIG